MILPFVDRRVGPKLITSGGRAFIPLHTGKKTHNQQKGDLIMTYQRQFIHTFREDIAKADMPAQHKLLLFTLTLYANSEGGNVYPAQETLADACCCTRRTIIRQMKHLQTAGWVELVRRGGIVDGDRAARATNRYQLQVGKEFTVRGNDVYLNGEEPPEAAPARAPASKTAKVVKLPVKQAVGHDAEPEADFEPEWSEPYDF